MRSRDSSKFPDEWQRSGRDARSTIATAVLLAIAVASLSFGGILAAAGNAWGLLYATSFAAIMGVIAAFGVSIRGQRHDLSSVIGTGSSGDAQATTVSYSRPQFALLVTLMTILAGTCVAGAIHLVLGHGMSVASTLLAVFGVVGATFPASVLLGRLRRGGLALSERVVSQRGWSFESSLTWAEIAGVKAAFNGHPVILLIGYANADWSPRYTTRLWRVDRLPPVPMIEIDCRRFDVDPHMLYDYLAYYAENANVRAELGTAAAVTRAQRMGSGL